MLNKEFKHYYEYVDFCNNIDRLIKQIWIKRGNLTKCNPTHNLRGKDFTSKLKLYNNIITRLQKVRYSWVDRHNKQFFN